MLKLLGSSAFMLSLALVAALATNFSGTFPEAALPPPVRSALTVGLLATMLTLSLSRIPARDLSPIRHAGALGRSLATGLVIPALIPLLGWLLLKDTVYAPYAAGLVFIAATPFAASVAPLSLILRGDMTYAARATIHVYLVALLWIPLVVRGFLGAWVDMATLFKIVLVIVGAPLLLSRLLTRVRLDRDRMAAALNCVIFFLVWLSVSTADFKNAGGAILFAFMLIVVLRTFGLGLVVDRLDKRLRVGWSQRVTDILMSSYKNKGIAIALCVSTLGERAQYAMVAIAASIVVEICWVIYMDSVLFSRKRMEGALAVEGAAV